MKIPDAYNCMSTEEQEAIQTAIDELQNLLDLGSDSNDGAQGGRDYRSCHEDYRDVVLNALAGVMAHTHAYNMLKARYEAKVQP